MEYIQNLFKCRARNYDKQKKVVVAMGESLFHRLLYDANKTLLENYMKYKMAANIKTFEKLYYEKDATFRGLRQT